MKLASSLHVLLLDLLCRAQRQAFNGRDVVDEQQHQQLCIALSKLASLSPNVQWYVTVLPMQCTAQHLARYQLPAVDQQLMMSSVTCVSVCVFLPHDAMLARY